MPYAALYAARNCWPPGYAVRFWAATVHWISGSIDAGTPPFAAEVQEAEHTPSAPNILAVGIAEWTSLVICTAPLAVTPAKKKQSAPWPWIVDAYERKLGEVLSIPVLLTIVTP